MASGSLKTTSSSLTLKASVPTVLILSLLRDQTMMIERMRMQ